MSLSIDYSHNYVYKFIGDLLIFFYYSHTNLAVEFNDNTPFMFFILYSLYVYLCV